MPTTINLTSNHGFGYSVGTGGSQNVELTTEHGFGWSATRGASDPAPANTAPPTIAGTAQVGETLTASPGTWTGEPAFTYAWSADGTPIDGATSATYTPTEDDIGAVITVTVTGTNDAGAASATSDPTAAVVAE